MEQSQESALRMANKELEAFSYSVAHELRAPLHSIETLGAILLKDCGSQLAVDGQRTLAVMLDQTHRMGQLIDDLLSFSRMEHQKLALAKLDLTVMAKASFNELALWVPRRTLQLALKPLPLAVGDPAMLRVVMDNLISNAIKFSKHRNPAVIEIGGHVEDGQTVCYVKDNGDGFDMQHAHKLFESFQRLHSAAEFEGHGIGLALVQRIIQRHGGRVWADGHIGAGATFYFSLPAAPQSFSLGVNPQTSAHHPTSVTSPSSSIVVLSQS